MRYILGAAALLLAAVTGGQASAQTVKSFYTGQNLFDECKRDRNWCNGFIMGVVDGVQSYVTYAKGMNLFCLPAGTKENEIIDVVMARLRGRPDQLKYDAPSSVMLALNEKYPCPK